MNKLWRCDLKSPCVKYCESKNNKHQCGIYKRDKMLENLNKCSNETCGRTYSKAEYGTTMDLCYSCNQKRLAEKRKIDKLRNRNKPRKKYIRSIEKLAYLEETK